MRGHRHHRQHCLQKALTALAVTASSDRQLLMPILCHTGLSFLADWLEVVQGSGTQGAESEDCLGPAAWPFTCISKAATNLASGWHTPHTPNSRSLVNIVPADLLVPCT